MNHRVYKHVKTYVDRVMLCSLHETHIKPTKITYKAYPDLQPAAKVDMNPT